MPASDPDPRTMTAIRIPVGADAIHGDLGLPTQEDPRGLVIFAHGSGSSRHSPRNQHVARALERAGLATLLVDLLTEREEAIDERTAHFRFDITLLTRRLIAVIDWTRRQPSLSLLAIGLFGASTGAGAALVAAAERPRDVSAVVSRGGRPDLAGHHLGRVVVPTMLIVGAHDEPVLAMNRAAMTRIRGVVTLEIVPGATHLFEEPGALDAVAHLAGRWFRRHFVQAAEAVAGSVR